MDDMWSRIRREALRQAAEICDARASVEGIAQACAEDIRALATRPAAICPRCGATDCVGCLTPNPKAATQDDYTTVAELNRWIAEASHYNIKSSAAERHLQLVIRARDELQEYDYMFELQQSRMGEAIKFWQEATHQPDVWPDLGKLLEWLCNEIVTWRQHYEAVWNDIPLYKDTARREALDSTADFVTSNYYAYKNGFVLADGIRELKEDDGCCHKTRIKGSGCPIGRKCPYDRGPTDEP